MQTNLPSVAGFFAFWRVSFADDAQKKLPQSITAKCFCQCCCICDLHAVNDASIRGANTGLICNHSLFDMFKQQIRDTVFIAPDAKSSCDRPSNGRFIATSSDTVPSLDDRGGHRVGSICCAG
jgi:hypothetical protein